MLVFNALQLALLGYTAWLAATRMRVVLFRLRADATPLARAMVRLIRAGDVVTARAIARAAAPSAFSDVVSPVLEGGDARALRARVDETYADVEHELERGVSALRSIASIAVAAGFCGATVHMATFIADDMITSGIHLGALDGAMSTMAVGVATAFLSLTAHRILKRARRDIATDVDRAVGLVEAASGATLDGDSAATTSHGDAEVVRNRRDRAMSQPA